MGADLVAGAEPGVHPDPVVRQGTELHEHAGTSNRVSRPLCGCQSCGRVLGVEPHLDGVAAAGAGAVDGQRAALGDRQLQLDQVEAGDAAR